MSHKVLQNSTALKLSIVCSHLQGNYGGAVISVISECMAEGLERSSDLVRDPGEFAR